MRNVYVCISGDINGDFEDKTRIEEYLSILRKYNIQATFPTTLEAVEMYPERIRMIVKEGHEIAGHGDVHKKFYGPVDVQKERLLKMRKGIYDILGIEVKGFRAPWCKWDKNTHVALFKAGLKYDSSIKRLEILYRLPYIRKRNHEIKFHKILRPFLRMAAQVYNLSQNCSNFPYYLKGVVEIPVLGYSDYYLINSPKGPKYSSSELHKIASVWLENLKFLLKTGGVLVINAHPHFFSPTYVKALDYFIEKSLKFEIKFETLYNIFKLFER